MPRRSRVHPLVAACAAVVLTGCGAAGGGPAAGISTGPAPTTVGVSSAAGTDRSGAAVSDLTPPAASSSGVAPHVGTAARPTSSRSGPSTAGDSASGTPSAPRRATGSPAAPSARAVPPRTTIGTTSTNSVAATTATTAPAPGSAAQAFVTAADVATARTMVAAMTPAQRAGAVIMASSADVVGTTKIADLHLGGVILMGEDGGLDGTTDGTPSQVAALTAGWQRQAGATPVLIGTDQEYGVVTRLRHGFTAFPGSDTIARIRDTGQAAALERQVTAAAAQEMLAVGISLDFAPDADILPASGESGIGNRSFGTDPTRVATLVAAAVAGYQSQGLATTLKHFPGLGRIAADTHATLPSLDVDCADWNTHESVPMAAGIRAGAAVVMTGHVHLPAVGADSDPTSLSATVVDDLLRGHGADGCRGLGFTGVSTTDSLQMAPITDKYGSAGAAVHALAAGQDLLLMPVDPAAAEQGIVAAVRDGALPADRLDDAAVRVTALRLAVARAPRPTLAVVGSQAHRRLADRVAAASG